MNTFSQHSTVTPTFAMPHAAALSLPRTNDQVTNKAPAGASTLAANDGAVKSSAFQVLHGDCIAHMRKFADKSFDLVLTDPPYIVGYRDRTGRTVANDDNDAWLEPAFREIYRVLDKDAFCISFYGWNQTDRFFSAWKAAGFRIGGHLTFPKRYSSSVRLLRYQHESAYLLVKGQPEPTNVIGDVIDWGAATGNKLHPTQKPLSITVPLIQAFSRPGARVLDPFMGSGTTIAASLLCGRHGTGIELDEKNFQIANKRLARIAQAGARLVDDLS
jgi:DNA modification methylase